MAFVRRNHGERFYLPDHSIRLTALYITLSQDIATQLNPALAERVLLGIEVDAQNLAIKLYPDQFGYVFSKNGRGTTQGLKCQIPGWVKQEGMPRGDYLEIPEMQGTFVWQDPGSLLVKPVAEPLQTSEVEVGDTVQWVVESKLAPMFVAEGVVVGTTQTWRAGKQSPLKAIVVANGEYLKHFKIAKLSVDVNKLTIVKKGVPYGQGNR